MGHLPQNLEQNLLRENTGQTNEPPYLTEIYKHSAVWPSGGKSGKGGRLRKRQGDKPNGREVRHSQQKRKDTENRKMKNDLKGGEEEVIYRAKKD